MSADVVVFHAEALKRLMRNNAPRDAIERFKRGQTDFFYRLLMNGQRVFEPLESRGER